jgi:hypothetical protein
LGRKKLEVNSLKLVREKMIPAIIKDADKRDADEGDVGRIGR